MELPSLINAGQVRQDADKLLADRALALIALDSSKIFEGLAELEKMKAGTRKSIEKAVAKWKDGNSKGMVEMCFRVGEPELEPRAVHVTRP